MTLHDRPFRRLLSKVPEVTVFFWIIMVLSVRVDETLADVLDDTFGLGLTLTTALAIALLAVALLVQFRLRRYVPAAYWTVVVLISVVGTLITDNLVDNLGVPLAVAAAGFAVALVATFACWHAREKTLSIHTVDTPSHEGFYWLAVLLTLALGAAAGDLVAGALELGYAVDVVVFAALLAVVGVGRVLGLSSVAGFWLAYLLIRPLGASLGDLFAQPAVAGGLGLGTVAAGLVFLAAIVGVVAYLSRSKTDQPSLGITPPPRARAW